MSKQRWWAIWFSLGAALAVLLPPAWAAGSAPGKPGLLGPLVPVTWLQRHLQRPDVLLLDASPARAHQAQHIPGAVNADVFSIGAKDLPQAEMQSRFEAWGISPGRQIVIYDEGGSMLATRLFWDLHYHGFPVRQMAILDGGLAKWREAGGAVTQQATPAPARGRFRITRLNEDARVRTPEMLLASGDPQNHALIEALEPNWHFGETAFFDRPGHIPGGVMMPRADFYNADKTFKSPAELRKMLAYMGVRPEQQVNAYCGGGIAASVPYFVAKFILGMPKVKLYKESEMGWLQDERGLPFWTYDAPQLMRATAWLRAWNGPMMRLYSDSAISIVDVRPAEVYRQGHLPFAVNVPAEVFRRHLDQPAQLAQLLGQAGVNPAHEAVVFSDAGLDESAALAFVALQRAGQRRVSVFMDTLDQWAAAGQEVARVSADASRPTLPPVDYTATLRTDVLVGGVHKGAAAYPRVYVASGRTPPTRALEAPVHHVPYADLLKPDGTPKAASDIWKLLEKAGVPRYAEIVSIADEPGAAAAAFYLLKLMGFPDVKMGMP
jgi:thiosulfate/3-mercaptopyruvate sulfurtransferase